jgi:multisubunit Na+/H+ antiporter MnhC subunit
MITKLKKAYELIKNWFWALPIWKRAILSSLIGAIGGSSIIGFFNKYALYYHALKQGFRIPIEGVEYINLAVSPLSFAFIITSIFGTVLIYGLLNLLANLFAKIFAKSTKSKRGKNIKDIAIIFQTLIGLLVSLTGITEISPKLTDFLKLEMSSDIALTLGIIFTVILIGYLLAKNESGRKIFTLSIVLLGISVLTISLFNQNVYSTFLRTIKYGGELPIRIEYRKADNTAAEFDGKLLIKTTHTLTLRNEFNDVEEIPIDRISKITYK